MPIITKKELQKLTAKNKLSLLFEALSEVSEMYGDKELHNEIIVIEAKYNGLKKQVRNSTIGYEDKTVTEGNIISSLAEIVSQLADHPYEVSDQLYLRLKQPTGLDLYKYLPLLLLLIVTVGLIPLIFRKAEPASLPLTPSNPTQNPLPDTILQTMDTLPLPKPPLPVASLYINPPQGSDENSQLIVGSDTFPLAYLDFAYLEGREEELNRLVDACYYQFEITNSNNVTITLQSLFVEVFQYKPIPPEAKPVHIQPFDEATVVYIHMGKATKSGANIYRNSFFLVENKKKIWGKIKVKAQSSEMIAVRINAKEPGIYKFQLGIEYYSSQNPSLVRKYILPQKTTWAFKKRPG